MAATKEGATRPRGAPSVDVGWIRSQSATNTAHVPSGAQPTPWSQPFHGAGVTPPPAWSASRDARRRFSMISDYMERTATTANLGFLLAKASQRWNELPGKAFDERGHGHVRPSYGSLLLPLW